MTHMTKIVDLDEYNVNMESPDRQKILCKKLWAF